MSEEILAASAVQSDQDSHESAGAAEVLATPGALGVGSQLRAAREARNMSVADAAKALKLSSHQVVALEGDDWSHLPGTIIRGFIRNYARLLKLDPEPLMNALTALQMPQPPTLDLPAGSNTALPQTGKTERRDYVAVFFGVALIVIALLAYFFVPEDFWQSKLQALTAATAPAETSEKPMPTPADPAPVSTQGLPQPESLPAPAAAAAPAQAGVAEQPVQPAVSGVPSSGLKLSFAQPSWVEIRDRSGQIIFSQLSPAGSQRDIEGLPPFALVIGNATNVTVQYKGKVVELTQRSKDDVARLNLE